MWAIGRRPKQKRRPEGRRFGGGLKWSGRGDSNARPQPWQGCALPLSYARSTPFGDRETRPPRDRERLIADAPALGKTASEAQAQRFQAALVDVVLGRRAGRVGGNLALE